VGTSRRGNRKWEGEGRGIWSVYFIYLNKNSTMKLVQIILRRWERVGDNVRGDESNQGTNVTMKPPCATNIC
jgi:hypothetical protein